MTSNEDKPWYRKLLMFGLRDLLLLVTIIAISVAWWMDRNRVQEEAYDIQGPLTVIYTIRTSPNSTGGNKLKSVRGMDFEGGNIVIYADERGIVLSSANLIEFQWSSEQ